MRGLGTNRKHLRDYLAAYLFLFPCLIIGITFVVIPIITIIPLSLTNWDLITGRRTFIGFENYFYLFQQPRFFKSIINTFYFAGVKVTLDLILSLFFAVLLNKAIRGVKIFRIAFFSPVVTSTVAVAMVWIWLFDPSLGPFNQILQFFGLRPLKWLYDPRWAMPSLILFSLWKGLGYDILIFLAGLQSIPQELIEAAMVDGADSWRTFRYITLPLLSPVIYFVVLIGTINAFKIFEQVSVMTPGGGPLYSTGVIVYYIYELAFQSGALGRAAAASVILFGMVLALNMVQRKVGRKYVVAE
jgi:ABC-type sugar transport system permease subunit